MQEIGYVRLLASEGHPLPVMYGVMFFFSDVPCEIIVTDIFR